MGTYTVHRPGRSRDSCLLGLPGCGLITRLCVTETLDSHFNQPAAFYFHFLYRVRWVRTRELCWEGQTNGIISPVIYLSYVHLSRHAIPLGIQAALTLKSP